MSHFLSSHRLGIAVSSVLLVAISLPLTLAPQAALAQSSTMSITPNQRSISAQSTNVVVSSDVVWQDTGISLKVGDTLKISATGSWTTDVNLEPNVGPDGYSQQSPDNFLNLTDLGACFSCASTPTPHWGALIGYVGSAPPAAGSYTSTSIQLQAQHVFAVGSNYQSKANLAGELWLNINDDAYSSNTGDNAGQVTASITDTTSIPLGGKWISPGNHFIVAQNSYLHLSAHAYGGVGGINHVNYTVWWSAIGNNPWFVACKVFKPTPRTTDEYDCNWNLKDRNGNAVPSGPIKVSFDVYDNAGNRILSPNGIHQGGIIPTITANNGYWSGYAAIGLHNKPVTFTEVTASWTVNAISCGVGKISKSAFWIGLGGINADLEQIGTFSGCLGGVPIYLGVWEIIVGTPGGVNYMTNRVKPHDLMLAHVKNQGNGKYLLELTDSTQNWTFSHVFTGSKKASAVGSAECIVEAPPSGKNIPALSNFGTFIFSGCRADNHPVGFGPRLIKFIMVNSKGITMANPSYLDPTGNSFRVVWQHA